MKNSKAGFLLVESLIVSTFVSVTLIYVYTQFKVVYDSYNVSFHYNTVNNLYKVNNIKNFLNLSLDPAVFATVDSNFVVELTECPLAYIANEHYCNSLFTNMGIAKLYLVNEDVTNFKALILESGDYTQDIVNFTDYIKHGVVGYRVIVQFEDGTFSSINVF